MNVGSDELRQMRNGEAFDRMMQFQVARAQSYYDKSAPLEKHIDPCGRATLAAMTAIYRGLLTKIGARPQRVLRGRVSLSTWSKLYISWRAMRGSRAAS